jgi:uncharacterized FlgJ-related protein
MDTLSNPDIEEKKKTINALVEEFRSELTKLEIEQNGVIKKFVHEHKLQKIEDLRKELLNM